MRLPKGQIAEVRLKYPHMMPEDYATWTEYLGRNEGLLEEVWYDVHVGQAVKVPAGMPDWMSRVADGVSRKRIDVVARSGNVLRIIEVKNLVNMESLGQVLTYRTLFMNEYEVFGPVLAMVVGMTADLDIMETARDLGVVVVGLEGVTA
ncbi:hypothetical protein LCGC14_1355360 [marine sediment metagenome]|uniref:DUF91 domain-containing protein n=1 Tax=marine sediment metagenome TaxID=412755 RepID=A0A0F9NBZ2_9ZZZZ